MEPGDPLGVSGRGGGGERGEGGGERGEGRGERGEGRGEGRGERGEGRGGRGEVMTWIWKGKVLQNHKLTEEHQLKVELESLSEEDPTAGRYNQVNKHGHVGLKPFG